MRRAHPFRFVRRLVGGRRVYYVIYDADPSRPRSTGIEATPENHDAAVSWAYANAGALVQPRATLADLTADMFTERCEWRRRVSGKGRRLGSGYFDQHRGRLVNHIQPRFGSYRPHQVQPADIDKWLMTLAASPEMKNKIVQTLRKVFDELEYRRIIPQGQNPARLVSYYHDDTQKRLPITMQEFRTLFPDDVDELVRIWGTLRWATFFYIMATTGMRPGEVAAMDLSYWIKGVGYPVAQAIEPITRQVKGLKTEGKGVTVKPAYLNDRAEQWLTMLTFQGAPHSGLLFAGRDGRGMPSASSGKAFKAACRRAGIDLDGRTQYSLRHLYSTAIATHLTEEEAARYLGQRTYRPDYDHREVVDKLKADAKMRDLSNRIF